MRHLDHRSHDLYVRMECVSLPLLAYNVLLQICRIMSDRRKARVEPRTSPEFDTVTTEARCAVPLRTGTLVRVLFSACFHSIETLFCLAFFVTAG